MKKLIMAVALVVGLTTFAQQRDGKRADREKLTTDQKVELQVKKMNKDLNLNEKQTEQVKALVTKQVQKRESNWKQRFWRTSVNWKRLVAHSRRLRLNSSVSVRCSNIQSVISVSSQWSCA